jgi:hypothetical protein
LRTFKYLTSLLGFLVLNIIQVHAQDTIPIPLKIKVGIDVLGPATYYSDKNVLNMEAYISFDLDESKAVIVSAGSSNYKFSQYNYSYMSSGKFIRFGMDFNLLKPDKSRGKYWFGVGLRYGLSSFNSEVPFFDKTGYWGTIVSSIPSRKTLAQFVEISPGVRAEIFKNFSMGWSIGMRLLVSSGSDKDVRPIYLPGFGSAAKVITAGINYFLVWNIPFKTKNVIMKKPAPEENEDNNTENGNKENTGTTDGSIIRQ